MKIPIEWLEDLVDVKSKPEELAKKLTLSGLETNVADNGKVLEVDILPNRGDCASVLGVAREVAAVLKIRSPKSEILNKSKIQKTKKITNKNIKVEVKDKNLCPRYMARIIENVTIKESPEWMKKRLELAGYRSINNVVDVTNYLLHELGQPMHAFDADKINGGKIVVRKALEGETIVTLDGVSRKLKKEMLLISDSTYPVALAGVMGGKISEVSDSTATVFLESAYFNPISISKTSVATKLRSESSSHFEKGVDYEMVEEALNRAAQMIAELSGGAVAGYKVDIKAKPKKKKTVELRQARIDQILGIHVPIKTAQMILARLGFKKLKQDKNKLKVLVPSWRENDVEQEIDLIEEVGRFYGYDKIAPNLPTVRDYEGKDSLSYGLIKKARTVMVDQGLYEIQTYSLIDPRHASDSAIKVYNPMTIEESALRTSMLPGLLKVISHNLRHQVDSVRIFEAGRLFLPAEIEMLAGAIVEEGAGFFELKAIVENLMQELRIDLEIQPSINKNYVQGKSADIISKKTKETLGSFGKLVPEIQELWDIKPEIFAFEISFDKLLPSIQSKIKYVPLQKFPKVERDLSMVVPSGVASQQIIDVIKKTGGEMVEETFLFDHYKDSQAYRIYFRDENRTLTSDEVNQNFELIIKALGAELGVKIRQ